MTAEPPAPRVTRPAHQSDPGLAAHGLSARALVIAVGLALLTGLAVQQIALVYNAGEGESSVPPVPAVMWLLVLVAFNHVLHRVRPRLRLRPGELLTIYAVLALSTAISGRFFMRMLLAFMTVPHYYERLAEIGAELPAWYTPNDPVAITGFFEGSRGALVPWGVWGAPVALWSCFIVVVLGGMFCLVDLFRTRWADEEHLRFPLLALPIELSGHTARARPPFVSDGLMWLGFLLGFGYALPVVVSPLWPNFPDWRATLFPFAALTSVPWNELRGIYVRVHPHLVGFGYLMSGENLFTIWAGYFAQKVFWVLMTAFGYRRPGWHKGHEVEQLMGGVIVLALWLLWSNRHSLAAAVRSAEHSDRRRVIGVVVSFAGAVWAINTVGVPVWLGASLMGMLYAEALVYARIRAETGLPSYWATTGRFEQRDLLFDLIGARRIATRAGFPALANFNVLGWMTMGQFQAMAAYEIENDQLGSRAGIAPRAMWTIGVGSVALGLLIAFWTHLTTFYDMGALLAGGSEGTGYWELSAARGVYARFLAATRSDVGFRPGPNMFRLGGAGALLLLVFLRRHFTQFPMTPWGYMITCSYGATFWPSFLLTWVAQRSILRYLGPKAYTRAIPLFLGISFGYMSATVAAVGVGFATGHALSFRSGKRLYFDI